MIKNLIYQAIIITLMVSCGDHQYNQDLEGNYGGGPLAGQGCSEAESCEAAGANLAAEIRESDPQFEERYFNNYPLDSAMTDYLEAGHLRTSGVRILKLQNTGDKLEAIVSLTDPNGKPTADYEAVGLKFFHISHEENQMSIESAKIIMDTSAADLTFGSVLDFSGSMQPYLTPMQSAAVQLYSSLSGINATITKFSYDAEVVIEKTNEGEDINAAIKENYPAGATALFDGIHIGLKALEKNVAESPGINLQMVFTDGVENSSMQSFKELKSTLKEYRVPQMILGMGNVDIKSLITLAADTNGLFYYLGSASDIETSMVYVGEVIDSLLQIEIATEDIENIKLDQIKAITE